jgi:hypothetical protein
LGPPEIVTWCVDHDRDAQHATISTGALPSTHGMIDNQWFDRRERRTVVCTDDAAAAPIGFGDLAPTLARIAGITLSRADGRALTEALAR